MSNKSPIGIPTTPIRRETKGFSKRVREADEVEVRLEELASTMVATWVVTVTVTVTVTMIVIVTELVTVTVREEVTTREIVRATKAEECRETGSRFRPLVRKPTSRR